MPGSTYFLDFQTAIVTKFRYRFFLYQLTSRAYLYFITNFSQIYLAVLEKMTIFVPFFFSKGDHLEFSTRLKFTILKPWSLIMLHMKLKIHGCSGLRNKSFECTLNGLKCQG